jgi:hypothetical protein
MEAPPLVDPDQPLPGGCVLRLPFPMARRVEDGSLVFWHTPIGLTFWIDAHLWEDSGDPVELWRRMRSGAATDESVEREDGIVRMSYRVSEAGSAGERPFYGFVRAGKQEFLIAAYFDSPELLAAAVATWRSIRAEPRPG